MKQKNLQSSIFKISLVILLGLTTFAAFGYLQTVEYIVLNLVIVALIVLSTRFLRHEDILVIASILTGLVGHISYLVISLGSGLQDIEHLIDVGSRVQLNFANPNFLANFLLFAIAGVFLISKYFQRYNLLFILLFPLVIVAIVFTGARVTLFVTLLLFIYLYIGAFLSKQKEHITMFSIICVFFLLIVPTVYFVNQQTQRMLESANLLKESEDFLESARAYRNVIISDKKVVAEKSPNGYQVNFISASSPANTGFFFFQGVKTSVIGESYVASVYLRADEPLQIRLSTQLSSVVCDVELEWSRCITPVGKGDDYAALQFRFETLEPNQSVAFYFAEPQLEIGSEATPYQPKSYPSRIYLLSKRFSQSAFSSENLSENSLGGRFDAWGKGWRLFLAHPWLGVGSGNFADYDNKEITHSHNIFIQVLATQGLVGFVMWFVVGYIMLSSMTKRQRQDFFPMLMVAFLANMTDYTFVHASSLYIFFFTWGCVYFNKIYPEGEQQELAIS